MPRREERLVSEQLHLRLAHVVHPIPVQSEAVFTIRSVDQRLDPMSNVLRQLSKEDFAAVTQVGT